MGSLIRDKTLDFEFQAVPGDPTLGALGLPKHPQWVKSTFLEFFDQDCVFQLISEYDVELQTDPEHFSIRGAWGTPKVGAEGLQKTAPRPKFHIC